MAWPIVRSRCATQAEDILQLLRIRWPAVKQHAARVQLRKYTTVGKGAPMGESVWRDSAPR